jgi:hypothetical protein
MSLFCILHSNDTAASVVFRMLHFLQDHNFIGLPGDHGLIQYHLVLYADVWGLVEPQGQDQTWTTTFLDIELQVSTCLQISAAEP